MTTGIAGGVAKAQADGAQGAGGGAGDEGKQDPGDGGQGGGGAKGDEGGEGKEGAEGKGAEGAGDAGKKAGANEGDGKKSEPQGAPETYADFKTKEGFELEPKRLQRVSDIFKRGNLPQDLAQELLDESIGNLEEVMGASATQFEADQAEADKVALKEWDDEIAADPKFGGERLDQTHTEVASFIKLFGEGEGGADTRKMLEETGLDRHPMLLRMFSKAGAHFGEATGMPTDGLPKGEDNRTPAERAYNPDGSAKDTKVWS